MDDLVAFLAARLDEDEAAAKNAPGENWHACTEDSVAGASVYDEQWVLLHPKRYYHDNPMSSRPGATGPQYIQRCRDGLAAHIARHDPARVLREVAARRWLLRQFELRGNSARATVRPPAGGVWDDLLRILALPYADHPDYRAAWKP